MSLIEIVKSKKELLSNKKVTTGFDGFIDTIQKIIRHKDNGSIDFFTRKKEFGNYILAKEGSSFSLELEEISVRHGGNMPIMSHALGQLGVPVNCIGAAGYPHVHPAFEKLSANCRFYSFADPGTSAAYEFNDGKIMLASMGQLNSTGWDEIKKRIGLDKLIHLYKESDLIGIVNWSEIDTSSGIWKGVLTDILPAYTKDKKQISFFDLSDCSKRTVNEIKEMIQLLEQFSRFTKVILSVNRNEAKLLYQALYEKQSAEEIIELGKMIFSKINAEILVVHSSKEAIAITKESIYKKESVYIESPVLSTGAGDNFNAGFCAAQLLEFNPGDSLSFANAVAGYYVKNGNSPVFADIINHLETNTY